MVTFYELVEKAFELERMGKKLIKLNVGDTNLPTPECAIEAGIHSIQNSKSGYVPSAGIMGFREKIAAREGCDMENVVVGSGSKPLIHGLMSILCKRGDTVAFPAPYWPAYELICNQLGFKKQIIKTSIEDRWEFGSNKFSKARLLIICNPVNPTSTVYSEQLMNALIEEANKRKIPVILDEAYKDLAFMKIPRYGGDNLIRVRSFSKEFNMEGWRLGYAIAPKEIAKKLVSFNHINTGCTPEFVQRAGIACLENESGISGKNRKIWQERAHVAVSELKKANFDFIEPDAGIYIFASHEKISDSGKFALKLLEEKEVVVAPGSGFGEYAKFIRICLNQEPQKLKAAISAIERQLSQLGATSYKS